MKKALKTVFAAVLTGAMAMSAFAVNASAYGPHSYVNNDGSIVSAWNDVVVEVTAPKWKGGTATVNKSSLPYGYTVVSEGWSNTNGMDSNGKITVSDASFSGTYTLVYKYTYGNTTVEKRVTATVSDWAFGSESSAAQSSGGKYAYAYGYSDGSYAPWYGSNYDYYGDYVYVNGKWYDKEECDYRYGNWYPYSYATAYDYNPNYYNGYYNGYYYGSYKNGLDVDWDTDTFYYNGKKQIPTATVTIGSRTIELDVRVISGDKDSTDVGSYRVSASLPSGYRGVKLSGSTLRYTIEEPLKQGLVSESGSTYYYQNGKYQTGWETVDGDTYYFEKDGKAATGWKWMDGAWYYFGNDGAMRTGWVATNGKTYYVNESGKMVSNKWQKLDGYWYFFGQDGAMAESKWVKTGSYWYYCAGDGRMATNTTIPGGYYVNANGVWVK